MTNITRRAICASGITLPFAGAAKAQSTVEKSLETKGRERCELYAKIVGEHVGMNVIAPTQILNTDGSVSDELRAFCVRYGASLDWLFCDDESEHIVANFERNCKFGKMWNEIHHMTQDELVNFLAVIEGQL